MTGIAATASKRWRDMTNLSGVTTASLLVVTLVATGTGALTGLFLGGLVEPVLVAVVAGLVGTVVAGIVRNTLLVDVWGVAGIEDVGTPTVVLTYAAVASLAGSLAAHQLIDLAAYTSPVLLGALAGILSAALMGLLMVAYRMNPEQRDTCW